MGLLRSPTCLLQLQAMAKAMKATKAIAFRGGNTGGATTLAKSDLVRSKTGKIVSKAKSVLAKKRYAAGIGKWTKAVQKARKELGVRGFLAIKKGTPLYKKAKEFFNQ